MSTANSSAASVHVDDDHDRRARSGPDRRVDHAHRSAATTGSDQLGRVDLPAVWRGGGLYRKRTPRPAGVSGWYPPGTRPTALWSLQRAAVQRQPWRSEHARGNRLVDLL